MSRPHRLVGVGSDDPNLSVADAAAASKQSNDSDKDNDNDSNNENDNGRDAGGEQEDIEAGRTDRRQLLLSSDEDEEDEEKGDKAAVAAVPTNGKKKKSHKSREQDQRLVYAVVILLLLLIAVTVAFIVYAVYTPPRKTPKNVILMISDGFGPASETMARNFAQNTTAGLPVTYMLPLDEILVGSSRTRSSSSLVTDSAAGATAFSCGIKSYNAAIAVDDDFNVCGTILEAAQMKGMRTGLVATSRITHATPASFAAHVVDRDLENDIAVQEVDHLVDVMFGGGLRHFIPQSQENSEREDDLDVIARARQLGYNFINSTSALNGLSNDAKLPVLGIFAVSDIPYQIDQHTTNAPSLLDMASKAIQLLHSATKDSDKGFFMMIEGSRIDHAAHSNDAATHLREILMYQDVVSYVRQFIEENPDTLMVSVSDHETGGLTIALQLGTAYPEYLWNPSYLAPVTNSTEVLIPTIYDAADQGEEYLDEYLSTVVEDYYGLSDVTEEELCEIKCWLNAACHNQSDEDAYYGLEGSLTALINDRAQLGWTTHGHSGVDVNLYATGRSSDVFQGSNENIDIGLKIADLLELDLQAATDKYSTSTGATGGRRQVQPQPQSQSQPQHPSDPADHYHPQRNQQQL